MNYEDDYQTPAGFQKIMPTIARQPYSCNFCGKAEFVHPGPCQTCGTFVDIGPDPKALRVNSPLDRDLNDDINAEVNQAADLIDEFDKMGVPWCNWKKRR